MGPQLRIKENNVRWLMWKRGISEQQDLAKAAGIAPQTLVRLLQGKPFTSASLEALALALDCNPMDLVNVEDYTSPLLSASAPA